MKQFLIGSAFLLFILSLPAGATNDHAISVVAPKFEPQKVAFLTSFGDTLPPIGYVNFCREHHPDCLPERKFADRVQLTAAKFRELDQVNTSVNTSVQPVTDLELYGKVEYWTYPTGHKGDCEDYVLEKRYSSFAPTRETWSLTTSVATSCALPTRHTSTSSSSRHIIRWCGFRFCRPTPCRRRRCRPQTATKEFFEPPKL
jgi:hypothetical protein